MTLDTRNMGSERLRGPAVQARYIGNDPRLAGRLALVGRPAGGSPYDVVAQFDDRHTGFAFGWHRFPSSAFAPTGRPIPPAS